MKSSIIYFWMCFMVLSSMQCHKVPAPVPENMNKHWFGQVIDRTDNTIVPNCRVGLYEGRLDGSNLRFTKIAEDICGADGKFEFWFTRLDEVNTYSYSLESAPQGYAWDRVFTGLAEIPDPLLHNPEINMNILTISEGALKVRFIGDGTGKEVILGGGGGTDITYKHGCDTIAWGGGESGKPAKFGYYLYKQDGTFTNHEINDIMIKFDTVYKEVHF